MMRGRFDRKHGGTKGEEMTRGEQEEPKLTREQLAEIRARADAIQRVDQNCDLQEFALRTSQAIGSSAADIPVLLAHIEALDAELEAARPRRAKRLTWETDVVSGRMESYPNGIIHYEVSPNGKTAVCCCGYEVRLGDDFTCHEDAMAACQAHFDNLYAEMGE